jgi:DNA-binding transcriptional LysR family regulator
VNLLSAEAFVTVVHLGSLQKAAERLGVSSATISRRLTELEAELGVRLVERSTRSLRVTDLGRAFHDRCTRALDAIEAAHDLVAQHQARVAGTVRLSTAPNLGPLLLGAIADVKTAHPEVHVVLVETERRLDLRHDDIDLFVRVGEVCDDRLVARRLGAYPHVLVASKEYVARAGTPATPEDLESHTLVVFGGRRRFSGWELVPVRGGAPVRVNVRPGLSTNDYATLAHAVRRGMGVGELPAILSAERASLVRVLPEWTLGEVALQLLFPADRLLSRAVRAVIDGIVGRVPGELRRSAKPLPADRTRSRRHSGR